MGTLVLKSPQNVLAPFAVSLVDTVIRIYTIVVSSRNSPRMANNLRWLQSLRRRLDARMAQTPEAPPPSSAGPSGPLGPDGGNGPDSAAAGDDGEGGTDLEFLGWKTRLIERVGQGMPRTRTFRSQSRSDRPSPVTTIMGQSPANASGAASRAAGGTGYAPGGAEITGDLLVSEAAAHGGKQDRALTPGQLDQFWNSIAGEDGTLTIGDIGVSVFGRGRVRSPRSRSLSRRGHCGIWAD